MILRKTATSSKYIYSHRWCAKTTSHIRKGWKLTEIRPGVIKICLSRNYSKLPPDLRLSASETLFKTPIKSPTLTIGLNTYFHTSAGDVMENVPTRSIAFNKPTSDKT